MKKKYTVVSLFSGIGGFDLGFEYAGFKIIWANEISANAAKTYEKYFKLKPVCADITAVDIKDIPTSDIIIGGPPCQSFSLVGRRSPHDERGRLVFHFLKIIENKMPRSFVMENVPGIAASYIEGQRLTDYLSSKFQKLGYNINILKLIATDYLVPQLRTRIFIIGSLRGLIEEPNPVLFSKECYGIDVAKYDLSSRGAIGDLGPCVKKGELAEYSNKTPSVFAKLMRRKNNSTITLHECPRLSDLDKEIIKHIPPGGNYQDIPDKIATIRVMKFKKSGGRTTTYGRLHPSRPSYTINTYFRRPNVGCNIHYRSPRLITPREAMRFQSFPDDLNVYFGSQDERNAYIGNAVPPLLAQAIAWAVRRCLARG